MEGIIHYPSGALPISPSWNTRLSSVNGRCRLKGETCNRPQAQGMEGKRPQIRGKKERKVDDRK